MRNEHVIIGVLRIPLAAELHKCVTAIDSKRGGIVE
jgi:hypothetical protein